MKINEIIKERRLERNLTQEQVAIYLGVTPPAVNKWEKGNSYPDITILPALARLLETDLNTLLSFKDELTEKEIGFFLNHLSNIAEIDGFIQAYDVAMEKIKDYPSCYPLILSVASFLDGALILDKNVGKYKEGYDVDYQVAIEGLYKRVLCSQDSSICNRAQSILISKLMGRKEYDKAQEMLQALPDENHIDKKHLQAKLYIAYENFDEAAKMEEEKLLSVMNEINTILMTLLEIAIKDNRIEDAEYIAEVSKNGAKLFDLWEYNSYVAHFQLYSACKNRVKCLKTFIPMLKSLTHKWDINKSPLYRHIKTKEVDNRFGYKMQKAIIQSVYTDEQTSFLRDDQEVQSLVKQMNLDSEEKK